MALKGIRGRIATTQNETKDVTVSEVSDKVALDVNIVGGSSGGGGGSADSTAANQTIQIAEAQSTNTKLDSIVTSQGDILAESEDTNSRLNGIQGILSSIIGVLGPKSTTANQNTQITEAQSTNSKLDTLIVATDQVESILSDIETNTSTSSSADSTEAKQDAQILEAQSTNTKLDDVITNTGEITAEVENVTAAVQGQDIVLSDIENNTQSSADDLAVVKNSSTVNVNWNYYDISYVTVGNGLGEVETLSYFTGVPGSGTLVLTLTYTYDPSNRITRVVRS